MWKKSKSDEELEGSRDKRTDAETKPESSEKAKDKRKKSNALDKFQERGYDTGFVYFEE